LGLDWSWGRNQGEAVGLVESGCHLVEEKIGLV
jgi:hypothetical protein